VLDGDTGGLPRRRRQQPCVSRTSLVHGLHAAGIPVAIGSQFPLTFPGAVIFAEAFYSKVLRGEDVRSALHSTRRALKEKGDETHQDWAALVGYVSLPEGYTDHLTPQPGLESASSNAILQAAHWTDAGPVVFAVSFFRRRL
jgi:hypothetical protein